MSKLSLALILVSAAVASGRTPITHLQEATPEDAVMLIIEEISHLRRPSGREQAVIRYFKHLFDQVKPAWDARGLDITFDRDKKGNLLIRLPATGDFPADAPWIAIQAHMDMVEVTADEDIPADVQFARGVRLTKTGDMLHSENFANSVGLDNSVGLAFCGAYLLKPELPHPPMEIVLTVNEEEGLVGAKRFGHELRSTRLINFDWEEPLQVCNACLGDDRVLAAGKVIPEYILPNLREVTVSLEAFPGGHTGLVIHEPRPNAALFGAELLARISGPAPAFWTLALSTPRDQALNAIPHRFTFTLASHPDDVRRLTSLLTGAFVEMKMERGYSDQALAIRINAGAPARANNGLSKSRLNEFLSVATELQNGVLERDETFPHGVRTSSSLGRFEYENGVGRVGFMLRSFDPEPIERLTRQNREVIRRNWPGNETPRFAPPDKSPTWWNDPDGLLFRLARQVRPAVQTVMASGGLELAIFTAEHPIIREAMALGVKIEDAHTPRERSYESSIRDGWAFARGIVEALPCEVALLRAAE